MPQAGMELVFKFVAGSARTCAGGVAPLHHKIGNHAMKHDAFVISFARQEDKVVYSLRCFISEEIDDHGAFISLHASFVFFLRVNLHCWWGWPLFWHFGSPFICFLRPERSDEQGTKPKSY